MDFDSYVVARRRRLVEHAVGRGVAEADAGDLVDRVLDEQRARISRAADPDPTTYAALDRAIRGPSPHRRRTVLATIVVTLALVVTGLAYRILGPSAQVSVPSAFSYDATDAAMALRHVGLQVGLTTRSGCEPHGLVVAQDPPAGARVDTGSTVLLTAETSTTASCPDAALRAEAWAFLHFTRGGPAPAFAATVFVVLDGREPAVLPAAAAADPSRWASIQEVTLAARRPAPTATGLPRLVVEEGVPPVKQCGVSRPAAAGARTTLRLQLLEGPQDDCPVTVDLYRSAGGVIDAVAIYSRVER